MTSVEMILRNSGNADKQHKKQPDWLKKHRWLKGQSGNPKGRPKGQTLKEFAREFLMALSNEEKFKFLKNIDPAFIWRMAEGNPHQTKDITSGGKSIGEILEE